MGHIGSSPGPSALSNAQFTQVATQTTNLTCSAGVDTIIIDKTVIVGSTGLARVDFCGEMQMGTSAGGVIPKVFVDLVQDTQNQPWGTVNIDNIPSGTAVIRNYMTWINTTPGSHRIQLKFNQPTQNCLIYQGTASVTV